jgi:hypothetical protein
MLYRSGDERRREALRALRESGLNGIDFLTVVDAQTLNVHFINPLRPHAVDRQHISITGGERIRDIIIVSVHISKEHVLTVKVNKQGDFAHYTLHLEPDIKRLRLDPQLREVTFTFRSATTHDFAHTPGTTYLPDESPTPEIDYMTRDFTGFRQLMLDRISTLIPTWSDRSPADIGVMLVEILAYVADHLSYRQDVIATESYLSTARRRISVRRHARLLDYLINEGCNARVWVQIQVDQDLTPSPQQAVALPRGTQFLTRVPGQDNIHVDSAWAYDQLLSGQTEVFESMYDVAGLYTPHNEMNFYTWGAQECWLAQGATSATLQGHYPHLHPGAVLIFKEVLSPLTGRTLDADPLHRHVVRLTSITPEYDPLGLWFDQENNTSEQKPYKDDTHKRDANYTIPVTNITWHFEDALPFPLCIATTTAASEGYAQLTHVSIALGNIVLADHGGTVTEQAFAAVPLSQNTATDTPPRFYPALNYTPLVFAVPYDTTQIQSASAATQFSSHDTTATVKLSSIMQDNLAVQSDNSLLLNAQPDQTATNREHITWHPRRDLLESAPYDPHFTVEVDDDGRAYLRFGDDQHGLRPDPGTTFDATYRKGDGLRGNVGPESLYHIASVQAGSNMLPPAIRQIENPLAATGGTAPQSSDDVRQNIARSFILLERGVTPSDYQALAESDQEVAQANALMRWTGSWYTLFLAVERKNAMPFEADGFSDRIETLLEPARMAGADLVIVPPVYVALDISIRIQVQPHSLRDQVSDTLQEIFSSRQWADGQRGIFYPGNYRFGQPVYLSEIYAAASAIVGVASLQVQRFQRLGFPDTGLQDGVLTMEWNEITRMENDAAHPEHGIIYFTMEGGR